VTANVRYRLDLDTAVGAYGTYRLTSPGALDASLFVERQNRFGSGRLQLDASNQNGDTLGRVNLDETWGLQVGMRLMTSVSAVFEDNAGVRTTGFAGALSGGGEITHSLSWDGSAGYQSTRGAWAASGFTADIGLTQRLGHGLTLSATWFDNRSKTSTPSPITPLIPIPAPPSVSHSSAVFVTLRYEFSAGTSIAPIGGRPGAGAGSIHGRLFLDADGDGLPDAGEAGAAGVTILLDGRYPVRTDEAGRYEFPLIAPGPHTISVVPDNLPLPWTVANDGRRTVTVYTRQTVTIDIAATRLR